MRVFPIVLLVGVAITSHADEAFYPTVDANGHVTVIKSKVEDKNKPVESPQKVEPASATEPVQAPVTPKKTDIPSVKTVDGDNYLDSEELERRHYQPDGKQRFYYLPGAGVHHEVIESREGLESSINNPQESEQDDSVLVISGEFQEITTEEVKKTYTSTTQCLSGKQLKHAQQWQEITEVWARDFGFDPDDTPVKILKMPDSKRQHLMAIRSFASRQSKPEFFMPVVVFLNEQGCVVGGGWRYWMHYEPETERRHAYVEGNMPLPEGVTYIELFDPKMTVKTPFVLSRDGSITLHILD